MIKIIANKMQGGPTLQVANHWVSLHKRSAPGWRWFWQVNGVQWPFAHVASRRMRAARSWALGRWELVIIPIKEAQ